MTGETEMHDVATTVACAAGCASRRAVLAGAVGAAALLAGCQTYGENTTAEPLPEPAPATTGPADPAPGTTGPGDPAPGTTGPGATAAAPPAAKPLVETANVPVGGGVVLEAERLVVTQPQAGVFKAFSAVCTHQGCIVTSISNGVIECGCHGSRFRATDGSVAGGPANRPLREIRVKSDATGVYRT
ncbi:Rieske (2Fe-2S) protein [Catellatospora vulcania]|uniref:Rieske (2Fe-2S) protein n=1 Tax=Catellatospora vulcania TaxID=1460450 RepID=UPI001E47FC85|nr:Rieske (2Fe-2S) protein [Catellatospora vulcania]